MKNDSQLLEELHQDQNKLFDEIGKTIIGQKDIIRQLLIAQLAQGHCLLIGVPGLAKTLMIRSLSEIMDLKFSRIQFTPDLMPSDITGTEIIEENKKTGERTFKFVKGPVFGNIILADEINRTPPKTQAALLEAMQEYKVTAAGEEYKLDPPFFVMATQNPIEQEGTYPLPEAQVDRFLLRLDVGYPSAEDEVEILKRRKDRKTDDVEIKRIIDPGTLIEMQEKIEDVHLDDDIKKYIVNIVQKTRNNKDVEVGSSPRGSLALMKLSMANAAMRGRDYVVPDDVKFITTEALSHRLVLKPGPAIKGVEEEEVIAKTLKDVPVPKIE